MGGFETNVREKRHIEGIGKAKRKGLYKERKPSVDVEKVRALRDGGVGASAIVKELGILSGECLSPAAVRSIRP